MTLIWAGEILRGTRGGFDTPPYKIFISIYIILYIYILVIITNKICEKIAFFDPPKTRKRIEIFLLSDVCFTWDDVQFIELCLFHVYL